LPALQKIIKLCQLQPVPGTALVIEAPGRQQGLLKMAEQVTLQFHLLAQGAYTQGLK
jgi:hypothetical protein